MMLGKYGKHMGNMGKHWKILENMGNIWETWENMGKYWTNIWKHIGKHGKTWENIGKPGGHVQCNLWEVTQDTIHEHDVTITWRQQYTNSLKSKDAIITTMVSST